MQSRKCRYTRKIPGSLVRQFYSFVGKWEGKLVDYDQIQSAYICRHAHLGSSRTSKNGFWNDLSSSGILKNGFRNSKPTNKYMQSVVHRKLLPFNSTVCAFAPHRLRGISGFHRKKAAACRIFPGKSRKKSGAFAPTLKMFKHFDWISSKSTCICQNLFESVKCV